MAIATEAMAAWKAARDALENHAKMGVQLQRKGLEMLQKGGDGLSDAADLVGQGIKIEADAKLEIYRLERNKPKR